MLTYTWFDFAVLPLLGGQALVLPVGELPVLKLVAVLAPVPVHNRGHGHTIQNRIPTGCHFGIWLLGGTHKDSQQVKTQYSQPGSCSYKKGKSYLYRLFCTNDSKLSPSCFCAETLNAIQMNCNRLDLTSIRLNVNLRKVIINVIN